MSSAPPLPLAAEFDRTMEAERARWLRRRFLWFCATFGTLNLLMAWLLMRPEIRAGMNESSDGPVWLALADAGAGVLLFGGAFLFVLLRPPTRRTMLRLATGAIITIGAISLLSLRLKLAILHNMRLSTWSREAFGMILGIHLLACLFFPWTPRECLRPGAVLLVLNALVLATQIPRGWDNTRWAITEAAFSPLLLAPGLFVCWWRYSRFRSKFRLLFESAAYRALQAEMASARRIHESCLPVPRRDGRVCLHYAYEPMREIGGDLLFVPPMCAKEDDALSVVLLDVTGHGVAAALTVNRLVGELERIFGEAADAPPRDVLWALNRYVYLTLARHNVFVTALCVRADAGRGVLQWASGGHPTAFLRRTDGRVEDLESTGMLLGAVDGPEYCPEQLEVPFEPGDAVIAYTDGATEARDAAGAALQTEGLRRLLVSVSGDGLAPADWPAALLRGVASHHEGPTEDDMLVVALHRPAVAVPSASPRPAPVPRAEPVAV
jgi:hypothetical protein